MDTLQGARTHEVSSVPETLNSQSFGIALAITWFAMMLWSPLAVPTDFVSVKSDLLMHALRLAMLGVVCIVYVVVQFFPFVMQKRRVKCIAVALAAVMSPFALLGNVLPPIGALYDLYLPLRFAAWACSGFSIAVMMLVWGYDMAAKTSYRQGVVNVAVSAMFSGAFFAFCAFLERPAASVLTMLIPFAMLAIWASCLRRKSSFAGEAEFECFANPVALTNVRLVLGKGATVFIFSYGFIMGISGSVGTQFGLSSYSFAFVGLATLSSGIVLCVMLKIGALTIRRSMFVWFVPFAVVCLFLLSISNVAGKVALLFAVFFVVNAYNIINTAYMGDGDADQLGQMRDMFSCESRSADMLGSAIGWAVGMFVQFVVAGWLVPYCYFLVAAILVSVTIASFVREEEQPASAAGEGESELRVYAVGLVLAEWEAVCSHLSEQYKLSARESEIFLLLSRGRNREYIHNLLFISPSTVRTHTYNIYQKMDVHNQQELIDVVENEFVNR